MTDVVDEQQNVVVTLQLQGMADIVGTVTFPSKVLEGETFTVTGTVKNTSTDGDDIFVKLVNTANGLVLEEKRQFLASNATFTFSFSVVMPANNLNLRVDAGHVA